MAAETDRAVGHAVIVYGKVQAESVSGITRNLEPNSPIFIQDQIITGSNGMISIVFFDENQTQLDLGRMSNILISEELFVTEDIDAEETVAEVQEIQEAIIDGSIDPSLELEEPSAGDVDIASESGGREIVHFDLTGDEILPDSDSAADADAPFFTPAEPAESTPPGEELHYSGTFEDLNIYLPEESSASLSVAGQSLLIDNSGDSLAVEGAYGMLTLYDNQTWTYMLRSPIGDTAIEDHIISEFAPYVMDGGEAGNLLLTENIGDELLLDDAAPDQEADEELPAEVPIADNPLIADSDNIEIPGAELSGNEPLADPGLMDTNDGMDTALTGESALSSAADIISEGEESIYDDIDSLVGPGEVV